MVEQARLNVTLYVHCLHCYSIIVKAEMRLEHLEIFGGLHLRKCKFREHEIKGNANLMQLGNFIDVVLARHVSGTYAHHQEH